MIFGHFSGSVYPVLQLSKEDAALVAACLSGDDRAWKELINRYQGLIYSVVRLYFRNVAADDVFQDVCVELYRRLDTINDLQSMPAWLITVTKRKCSQALGHIKDWTEVEADSLSDVDKHIDAIEHRFWIEKALDKLEGRDRALIEALYLDPDQPSYAEIAERMSMPIASIGPTRARCLQKLRAEWDGVESMEGVV